MSMYNIRYMKFFQLNYRQSTQLCYKCASSLSLLHSFASLFECKFKFHYSLASDWTLNRTIS